MSLQAGTRIGAYEIIGALGTGGMGEVYRARDTRLKRDVAVKVLSAAFAADPERLARFAREAEVLATLNHPNIAAIYGVEEAGGSRALVMELVTGETLADRLGRGPILLDDTMAIARQIAQALEAAHELGIIHRDLKPANINVRDDGTVKVLDFGLAKMALTEPPLAAATSRSLSPTMTSPALATHAGMLLGTPAYMSPEQAKGRPADKRSDVWAFGCVLFEMLTGERPFRGDDVGEVLASVVKVDVPWASLDHVPGTVRILVQRCLRKDARQRLGDGRSVRLELEELESAERADAPSRDRVRAWPWSAIAALVLLLSMGVVAALWYLRAPATASIHGHLTIVLPPGLEMPAGPSAAISPDGTTVVYIGARGGIPRLYARPLGDFDSHELTGTENARAPFFSSDSKSVGFFTDHAVMAVSLGSGVISELADTGRHMNAPSAAWNKAGVIVFTSENGLFRVSPDADAARPVVASQANEALPRYPSFLPDGERLLVAVSSGSGVSSIELLTLATGERRRLIQDGTYPVYLESGHIAFLRGGTVMVVPFDAAKADPPGTPTEVIRRVRTQFNGVGAFGCSLTGTCFYVPGATVNDRSLVLVDRGGVARPVAAEPRNYSQPKFSPDGKRILYWLEQSRCDIEYLDRASLQTVKLTSEGDNHSPVWISDDRIAFISRKPGATGYNGVSKSVRSSDEAAVPGIQGVGPLAGISRGADGTFAYVNHDQIWVTRGRDGAESQQFSPSHFHQLMPTFSPDGRLLAYVSDDRDQLNVYIEPFPATGERIQVSPSGGVEPVWSRNSAELFFRNGSQVFGVKPTTAPSLSAGVLQPLFFDAYVRADNRLNYDVSADGTTFVMLRSSQGEQAQTSINVMFDWFNELRTHMP